MKDSRGKDSDTEEVSTTGKSRKSDMGDSFRNKGESPLSKDSKNHKKTNDSNGPAMN